MKMILPITLGRIFLFILLLLPSIARAYTETLYVCQGGNGSNPKAGVCATALDDSALNNSSYWDTDVAADGRIGPDDLVLFMDDGGAFTSNMDTKQDGHSASQPITFSVAPGDTVTWNGQSGKVIDIDHRHITIDCDDRMTINHSGSGSYVPTIHVKGSSPGDAEYFSLIDCKIQGPARIGYRALGYIPRGRSFYYHW
jgi:hypothetical protein